MKLPYSLKPLLAEKYIEKPGVVGRYSTSAVWGILNGYTTPEEYLKGKPIDFISAFRMWQGTSKHNQIQSLFEGTPAFEIEKKIEHTTKYGWVLVGKADLLEKDCVIELKTSSSVMDKAKKWAEYQCKIYCTLFEKPEGVIVQPIVCGNDVYLKELGRVKRSDAWFEKEMAKLNEFHSKLLKYV